MTQAEKFNRQNQKNRRLYDPAAEKADLERLSMLRLFDEGQTPAGQLPRNRLIDLAGRIYETRRARSRYFHDSLLGEPVWDMLLALFCVPTARWKRMTVTRLCEAAGMPLTTGLRWLRILQERGLIERGPDPLDGRRVYVALTETGDRLMCDYLTSIYHRIMDG